MVKDVAVLTEEGVISFWVVEIISMKVLFMVGTSSRVLIIVVFLVVIVVVLFPHLSWDRPFNSAQILLKFFHGVLCLLEWFIGKQFASFERYS